MEFLETCDGTEWEIISYYRIPEVMTVFKLKLWHTHLSPLKYIGSREISVESSWNYIGFFIYKMFSFHNSYSN